MRLRAGLVAMFTQCVVLQYGAHGHLMLRLHEQQEMPVRRSVVLGLGKLCA
jgi:hypothetical protein